MQVLILPVEVFTLIIRPISKHLLIHSISYSENQGSNGWDDSFTEPTTIDFVRVNPSRSVDRNGTAEGVNIKHIVFVDKVNSSAFPNFKEKSKIVWEGQTFELSAVKPYYDVSPEPHHYELGLS